MPSVFSLNKNKLIIGVTLIIMLQNAIWPFWSTGLMLSYALVFVLFALFYMKGILRHKFSLFRILIIFSSVFVFLVLSGLHEFRLSSFFIILAYLIALLLEDDVKIRVLKNITKIVAIVIAISLPAWLYHVFVNQLTLYNVLDLTGMKGSTTLMNNYLFFVTLEGKGYFRFYSMFDEPGVLGTLGAFLLFANKYNFRRWENVVILLGCIFTYSMAFYVLTLLGYFYFSFKNVKRFLISFFFLTGLGALLFYYLQDDPAFQAAVVYRFQNLDDNSVDSRTGANVNAYYDSYITSWEAIPGKGTAFLKQENLRDGASYKLFVIEYGILGMLTLLGIYLSMIRKWNRDILMLFFIFMLSFTQRPLAFTVWQILLFACCVAVFQSEVRTKKV